MAPPAATSEEARETYQAAAPSADAATYPAAREEVLGRVAVAAAVGRRRGPPPGKPRRGAEHHP